MIEHIQKTILTFENGDLRGSAKVVDDCIKIWISEGDPHEPCFLEPGCISVDEIERAPLCMVFKSRDSLNIFTEFLVRAAEEWDERAEEDE